MKALLLSLVLVTTSLTVRAFEGNHCKQFDKNAKIADLFRQLAKKLQYDYEEFCNNPRIADLYHEEKLVYHREDDQYHPYEFLTIHYNEYSCQYRYSYDEKAWKNQECYNTF